MKNNLQKINRKYILMGLIPIATLFALCGLVFLMPAISDSFKLPVMGIAYFTIVVLVCMGSLFIKAPKFPVVWLIMLVPLTFFLRNDIFWADKLVWFTSFPIILFLEGLLLLLFGLVSFRAAGTTAVKQLRSVADGNESTFMKLLTIPYVALILLAGWWLVDSAFLATIYHLPGKTVQVTANVYGLGSTRGKYYYHRYWKLQFSNGKKENFWVYAAANTETGYKCSTIHDPKPGATVYITGRQHWLGFSYEKVDSIFTENGTLYCP